MSYAIFKDAILNKKQVVCSYKGHERLVCPHVIGAKNGKPQVLTWQFGGGSSSGLPPGGQWRCMELAGVSAARSNSGEWHTGANHSRPQTCVDEIDVEVEF